MADFNSVEVTRLKDLLAKYAELLSLANNESSINIAAGAGQETINDLNTETASTLNLADKTVIDKFDSSATKSLAISELVSFVSGQIGGGGNEFNKQGHFNWVADGGDGVTGYKLKDIVYHNGIIYISTADNNTTVPGAVGASWDIFYQNASTSVKGIVQLQSTVDDTEGNAATPKAINRRDVHIQTNDYKKGARVQDVFGGVWYEAVKDVTAVQALTNNPTFWLPSSNFKIFNSEDILTTGRALTASDINKHLSCFNAQPQTFTIPPGSSIPSGSVIYIRGGQSISTFNCVGSDEINVNSTSGVRSCSCFGGEVIVLVNREGSAWSLTKINPRYQYVSLTASRAYNTTYTNQTGFELEVLLTFNPPSAANTSISPIVDGLNISQLIHNNTIPRNHVSFKVPAGSTYRIDVANLTTVFDWIEYRAVI